MQAKKEDIRDMEERYKLEKEETEYLQS